jgi:hypothetical protein
MMLIFKKQYIVQRAREAYLISICQSEALFNLFYEAQIIDVSSNDINALNKRFQWQIINQSRDLKYIKLNQSFLRFVVFIDSSFVNNSDLSSQIDYVICLADATHAANILYWSSVKCKRITRSVLAVKLFAMIHDFDVDFVFKVILTKMIDILISLILITDSKSIYDCLIRLNITVEKRLMIDVLTLRQCYERREITEVKWVHETNNSVNSMIKIKSSTVLKTMIDVGSYWLTKEWIANYCLSLSRWENHFII